MNIGMAKLDNGWLLEASWLDTDGKQQLARMVYKDSETEEFIERLREFLTNPPTQTTKALN